MKINLIICLLFIFSTVLNAASNVVSSKGKHGFTVLKAEQAKNFKVPVNARLLGKRNIKTKGFNSKRYQQLLGNAEVLGGQLTVVTNQNGDLVAVIGGNYAGLMSTNDIKLKAKAAQAIAAKARAGSGKWSTRLMINPANGRYFYMIENQGADSRWFHWIDADDGSVVNAYNGLTTGTGTGVQGDTRELDTRASGAQFQMLSADGRQTTYDAKNKSRLPGSLATDSDDVWDTAGSSSPGQAALVDAHFFAAIVDNYFLAQHAFNWMADYPQGIVSSAHVGRNYNNAYWNGSQMAYGDGDGVNLINLSGDLDVVGHELAHGVTEATSGLIYQNESGALNEAFSDIMGTSIEFDFGSGNWTIGEDITPGDNGIRNMQNPPEDGDPSHYADRYTGSGDNGGVHTNSGIANHWYYLLVNGGKNAVASRQSATGVVGIGISAAQQIAYDGFTSLTSTADFCAARGVTVALSSGHETNVTAAWDEVGVSQEMCDGGGTGSGDGPQISNVTSTALKRSNFNISWATDILSTSAVTFTCCGTYTKASLVTNHSFTFRGTRGAQYVYFVTSQDANGNATTEGPFTHQN